MKRVFIPLLLLTCNNIFSQNIGIGITDPKARLHVDSSVVFTGNPTLPVVPSNPPVSGPGIRMMWYPDKSAFRAGAVNATQWNKDNIGYHSFASGNNCKASGVYSAAFGDNNIAGGWYSIAAGVNSQASGVGCIAIGHGALASGYTTYSLGLETVSTGTLSYAFGEGTFASGYTATSMGAYTKASSEFSLVIGKYNDTTAANSLFEIGNGTEATRRNAMTVLRNGNVGIGVINPARPLSFPAALGEKILLYPGAAGEVGIGVYGNELRLHADNPGAKVSFGTQNNAGVFTEAGKFEIANGFALSVFGNIWANGVTYNSDARFKKNIVPLKNSLQKIMQLKAVQYEMMADEFPGKNFRKGEDIGLLAQEVEAVVPQVVATNADGYKSVDYAKLVPLLIESIQDLKAQISSMQEEIKLLKKK